MVNSRLSLVFALSAVILNVQGVPLYKRIAQVISDSTQKWENACDAAGGGQQCNPISVTAFTTLLAAAGPCEQQNSADAMIDLAKQLNNDPDMIKFAQIFAQQPRNTPNSQAVPYCQQAPKNSELNGLFQCQFQGANQKTFVGGLQVGAAGTIPFGMSSPLSPAGSCAANPEGPIADGSQLVDLTQDPGLSNVNGTSSSGNSSSNNATATATATGGSESASATATATDAVSATASDVPSAAATSDCMDPSSNDNGSGSDSQSASPSATATATATDASTTPTDVTATATDASATATATDASATATDASASSTDTASSATPTASSSGSGDFQLQNGKDAQALNAKFATLTADSPCSEGDQACVSNGFAQCVQGKFVVTDCGGGLMCAALPLVNKAGTSIACTTQADTLARIQATGAQGGITGN